MFQCGIEELLLLSRGDIGYDHDESSMKLPPSVQSQKIRPVIGHKRVVTLDHNVHELPVFETA